MNESDAKPAAAPLADSDLDAVAGGQDVQLSPNVINMCREVNERGGLQFDLPNYARQNAPIGDTNPYYWNAGGAPPMWNTDK